MGRCLPASRTQPARRADRERLAGAAAGVPQLGGAVAELPAVAGRSGTIADGRRAQCSVTDGDTLHAQAPSVRFALPLAHSACRFRATKGPPDPSFNALQSPVNGGGRARCLTERVAAGNDRAY